MEAAGRKLKKAAAVDMEKVAKKLKAAALEIEAARMKLKAAVVDMEEVAKKLKAVAHDVELTNICDLNDDEMLNILSFLDVPDKISFAFTCRRLRGISEDGRVFRRVDLSRRPILRTERIAINELFRNRQVAQQITELNISNIRVFNWQMNKQLEEFIISICPHLQALHVVNCGMSLRRLHSILQNAPKLTSLSWSLWDITSEDIEFVLRSIESRNTQTLSTNLLLSTRKSMSSDVKSSDRICLKNIKHLHLEIYPSRPHVQILEYLVLSCCKDIEELEICIWNVEEDYYTGHTIPLRADQMIPGFPQKFTFIADVLLPLHSLTVRFVGDISSYLSSTNVIFEVELRYFIFSVVEKKSRETKWRKFWVLPPWYFSLQKLLHLTDPCEFQSVEEITALASPLPDEMDELKTLFKRIDDKTVRKLCSHQFMSEANMIRDLWQTISRVGGHALKFLSLSFDFLYEVDAETNIVLHTLFSNCLNIRELGLLHCHFEKDICEPLSKLKHLTKVQLMQCAISLKHNRNEVEISKTNLLTFVENCKKITHLDVRGCPGLHKHFSCRLTDGHLLVLAKLSNLQSLTLCSISGIKEWKFLQNFSENCKFLTMLRIEDTCFNNFHFLILMQSAKFLKHLALHVEKLYLQLEAFWNLLSYATNLERLCIRTDCYDDGLINVRVAVETLKSLPQLQVLHLHSCHKENVEVFHNQIERILEEENSDRSSFFELVTNCLENCSLERKKRQVFKKALPINKSELCDMTPVLFIPRF